MTLITRQQKGSKLTIEEMDGNLTYLEELAQSGGIINEITYSNFVTLIQNEELVPLQYYKITDYQTVHYIMDGYNATSDINTGSVEPLIVKAISNNQIDKVAISLDYTQDLIYYDWNPDNWLNSDEYSDGTIVPGFKGVIFRRIDMKNNNDICYDFRNFKMRRWNTNLNIANTTYQSFASWSDLTEDVNDYVDVLTFNMINGLYENIVFNNTINQTTFSFPPNLVININSTSQFATVNDNYFGVNCYVSTFNASTFQNIMKYNNFNSEIFENVCGVAFSNNNINGLFGDNIITQTFDSNHIDYGFMGNSISGTFSNNHVGENFQDNIISGAGVVYNNKFGVWFTDNEITSSFGYNNIGSFVSDNIFNTWCQSNTIYDYFTNNTIDGVSGSRFEFNNIGVFFNNNNFDLNSFRFSYNKIGDSSSNNNITVTSSTHHYYNNIGDYFRNNTIISDSFSSNEIGTSFDNNELNGNFYDNVIGTYFRENIIGNYFETNIVGNYFDNNNIGNGFASNTVGNNVRYLETVDASDINDKTTYFRFNTIKDGVQGTLGNEIELSTSEYYEGFNTETIIRQDSVIRMFYYDNNDEKVFNSPTV